MKHWLRFKIDTLYSMPLYSRPKIDQLYVYLYPLHSLHFIQFIQSRVASIHVSSMNSVQVERTSELLLNCLNAVNMKERKFLV